MTAMMADLWCLPVRAGRLVSACQGPDVWCRPVRAGRLLSACQGPDAEEPGKRQTRPTGLFLSGNNRFLPFLRKLEVVLQILLFQNYFPCVVESKKKTAKCV